MRPAVAAEVVAPQRLHRKDNHTMLFPRDATDAATPWRDDMSFMIEDLARDRMREMQRDSERARQIRQARQARRAAKNGFSPR